MISGRLASAPQPVNPPRLSRRPEPVESRGTAGTLNVLRSSRAPAQLSLFERPRGGR